MARRKKSKFKFTKEEQKRHDKSFREIVRLIKMYRLKDKLRPGKKQQKRPSTSKNFIRSRKRPRRK